VAEGWGTVTGEGRPNQAILKRRSKESLKHQMVTAAATHLCCAGNGFMVEEQRCDRRGLEAAAHVPCSYTILAQMHNNG
jgi:hypothetical protein